MYQKTKRITFASELIEKLAGSVKAPEEFKEMSVEKIVQKSKIAYFKNKIGG